MKKKLAVLFALLGMLLGLGACERQTPPAEASAPVRQTVALTVWGAEEDTDLLRELIGSFETHYAGEASFQITIQPQSESNCKDALLGDLEAGADVFTFADDQVAALLPPGRWTPSRTRRPSEMRTSPQQWTPPAWTGNCTPTL